MDLKEILIEEGFAPIENWYSTKELYQKSVRFANVGSRIMQVAKFVHEDKSVSWCAYWHGTYMCDITSPTQFKTILNGLKFKD